MVVPSFFPLGFTLIDVSIYNHHVMINRDLIVTISKIHAPINYVE